MSKDLISRKAAIDKFIVASNQDGAYGYLDTKSAVEILNDLPSVQLEEVIPHREVPRLEFYWCECGKHLGEKGSVKYCPECGKKVKWDENN